MGAHVIAGGQPRRKKLAAAVEHGRGMRPSTTRRISSPIGSWQLTEGRGADVCFDPVGGSLFDAALSSLGMGRGASCWSAFVAGVPQIPANRLLVKHRAALGSSLRYFRWHAPEKLPRLGGRVVSAGTAKAGLKPCVTHRLPLEQSVEAIRLLTERRAHGKVVVELEPS